MNTELQLDFDVKKLMYCNAQSIAESIWNWGLQYSHYSAIERKKEFEKRGYKLEYLRFRGSYVGQIVWMKQTHSFRIAVTSPRGTCRYAWCIVV